MSGWLGDLAGHTKNLVDEIDSADLVVMVATAGENAEAASIIGEACSLKRVMTTALVVAAPTVSDAALAQSLAQLRPWALMLVVASAEDYIADMLAGAARMRILTRRNFRTHIARRTAREAALNSLWPPIPRWCTVRTIQKIGRHEPAEPAGKRGRTREDTMLRKLMAALLAAAFSATAASAQDAAANYPNRPIKIIVCVPAGGGVDTVTRVIAEGLEKELGQTVVVENRAGAAGNIGANVVFNSDPDGYTLLAAQPSPLTVNPLLYKSMTFRPDPVRAGGDHVRDSECAAGAAEISGQDGQGTHRLRQGQSRQDQLRFARHRHDLASDRGAVRTQDRHQDGACSVQRHLAGAQRPHRRPCRLDLHGAVASASSCTRPAKPASWRWRR